MLWVNNARTLAAFAVVLVHVAGGVMQKQELGSPAWWTGSLYDALARWCVPAFVMISGLLLLDPAKQEPTRRFYDRRAKRLLVPLLFWTTFFLGWTSLGLIVKGEQVSVFFLLKQALSGQPYYHIWYLYMLAGLYLFVPYIREIVRHTSYKGLLFLCALLFAFSAMSEVFVRASSLKGPLFVIWFLPYLPYFLAGYLVNRTAFKPHKLILVLTLLLATALTSIGSYVVGTRYGLNEGAYFYSYLSVTVIPMSVSVMLLMKTTAFTIVSERVSRETAILSLGVYLIHPVFLDLFNYLGFSAVNYEPLLSVPIISLVIFLTSLSLAYMIHRTPYLNRVI